MPDQAQVAPHSLDAERAVLGSIMLIDRWMGSVRLDERLRPEDFYLPEHCHVFSAMIDLHENGRPIDHLTVAAKMAETGHPPEHVDLESLSGYAAGAGHVREYARIVRDLALRRRLLQEARGITSAALAGARPVRDLIEQAERSMLSVADVSASDLRKLTVEEELARLEQVRAGQPSVGQQTGFVDLDKLTTGLHKGNLLILAARPSMGKSSLAMNVVENVAEAGSAVAVFSLEMSRTELLRRMIASQSMIPGENLVRGPIDDARWKRLRETAAKVADWPLYVDDDADVGVLDIRARARRLSQRVDLALVVVDYLQLMRADASAESRNIEVGRITRGLKVLAKELDVPVLALSQLSRAVEHRSDKRPVLSDLRDSGSVEQDADVVMFLYREGYYEDDAAEPEKTELNVAKQRNGPTGRLDLTFLEHYPRFANYASPDRYA